MKMIQGDTGAKIINYGEYISNCQLRQLPYKIPVVALTDVQLYIQIGPVKPEYIGIELIHTCGAPWHGNVQILTAGDYIIGQDTNANWYAVFKNLTGGTNLTCFVISVEFTAGITTTIYYSEEYCVQNACETLTLLQGCYGNLDNLISYDCDGVYFGVHAGDDDPLGDTSIVYNHKLYLRGVEVTLSGIKNSFKQGRTRNFRTEKEKLYQFWSELVPEWYINELDAIFNRGEVYVGNTKYLVNETNFEKIEECKKQWKPAATFKESCFTSFSCESEPCEVPVTACCDPVINSVTVTEITTDMNTIVIQSVVDGTPEVTGTYDPVTGITDGSSVVICAGFAGARVRVVRGNLPLPGIDPLDGGTYFTKNISDNFITFSTPLVNGEFIRIETIPE